MGGGGKNITNALTHFTRQFIPPIFALFYLIIDVIGLLIQPNGTPVK